MFCPQCGKGYTEQFIECPECRVSLVPSLSDSETLPNSSPDVLIRTGFGNPVAVSLIKSLFQEAGIPFFVMDQNPAARQESGNILGWWSVRVPLDREAEAREILQSVEKME